MKPQVGSGVRGSSSLEVRGVPAVTAVGTSSTSTGSGGDPPGHPGALGVG